jgi:hypothetical protein
MEDLLIDYESLWKNGMGLHKSQYQEISKIILQNNIQNVVEFGSGGSTSFLAAFRQHHVLNFKVTSFDHSQEFSFKGSYEFLDLKIRNLVKCNDEEFERCFRESRFLPQSFEDCQEEQNNFRVRNSFYGVEDSDIPGNVDFVILDGPNGNGRSLAFPILKNKISDECFVMIDDEDHYDFLERCQQVFDVDILKKIKDPSIHPLFSYCLLKIRNK